MKQQDFQKACERATSKNDKKGIGTLGEKTLHAVLKYYYEPHEDNHEIKLSNYVADILGENGIIEIQTRGFERLRTKLTAFLEITNVTIVYPIPKTKWIHWIDPETGEISQKRKSPKTGKPFDIVFELYKIKHLLNHPNLCLVIPLLDVDEYRNLDGWSKDHKKGSSRYERIPIGLIDEIHINCVVDYAQLIPPTLSKQFTSKDLKKATGTSLRITQAGISVFREVGIIKQIGKQGRCFLYEIKADFY